MKKKLFIEQLIKYKSNECFNDILNQQLTTIDNDNLNKQIITTIIKKNAKSQETLNDMIKKYTSDMREKGIDCINIYENFLNDMKNIPDYGYSDDINTEVKNLIVSELEEVKQQQQAQQNQQSAQDQQAQQQSAQDQQAQQAQQPQQQAQQPQQPQQQQNQQQQAQQNQQAAQDQQAQSQQQPQAQQPQQNQQAQSQQPQQPQQPQKKEIIIYTDSKKLSELVDSINELQKDDVNFNLIKNFNEKIKKSRENV